MSGNDAANGNPAAILQMANEIPLFVDQIDHIVRLILSLIHI